VSFELVVVVVVVLLMDVWVTVDWRQYNFMSTCQSKNCIFLVLPLVGGLDRWNA